MYVSHQKVTKKVASYADLGNLLCRMAREEKKKKKISRYKWWVRLQHLNAPCTQVQNPERKTGTAFLFCSLAARYPPDLRGWLRFSRRPLAAAARGWRPHPGSAPKTSPHAHTALLSPSLHCFAISESPPPKKHPLLKGAQTRVKLHPNPTDRDW